MPQCETPAARAHNHNDMGGAMRIALFVTCLVDMMRPRIGFAAIELLEAAGCEVIVPGTQTCCGQPAWNSGDHAAAAALAKKVIGEFEGHAYVVAPSGSCADHIRNEYPKILADEPEWHARAVALASRVFELTDFLVNVARLDAVPGRFAGSVTYHDSCSGLRGLDVKTQPRALLGKLPGVELREMAGAEDCCGFGGTFSVKFGDISAAIAERKCGNACATGAGTIVGGDLGCLLNIEGKLRRMGDERTRVMHIAEVLTATDGEAGAC
jgi:L-lactate dehydrogenase complex protein LldE